MTTHDEELNQLRGRQLAIIRTLAPEDAIEVLRAVPISQEEEPDIVANMIQRHMLLEELEGKGSNG